MPPIRVCALYRFTPFPDPAALQAPLLAACEAAGVRGTVLLAREGINGTIAGADAGMEAVLAHIRALPGCATLDVKEARAETMPFHRTKVRLKREIVTMGEPAIDPLDAGHYVDPAAWNALIADPATLVIDTRNDYEVAVGTFAGAVDPQTRTFREFPAWFRAHREELLAGTRQVAMFCTGGIRCEKAAIHMQNIGYDRVYQLDGGILKYFEEVGGDHYSGDCFVFDYRTALNPKLEPTETVQCFACRAVVTPRQQLAPEYVVGVSCPHCAGK